MKKFKFKLESVLRERKRQEDLRLKEWSIAQKILAMMKQELIDLENQKESSIRDADKMQLNIALMVSMNYFIQSLKTKMEWKQNDIAKAERLVERTKKHYLAANQKRKVLEKLKEKKYEAFKKVVHQKELKQLDDIYIMTQSARRRAEEEEAGINAN